MQTKKILAMVGLWALALTAFAVEPNPKMAKTIDRGMKLAQEQAMRMYETVKDKGEFCFPSSAEADGSLKLTKARDWVSGFYPGELWYIYEYSQDERVRKAAEDMTLRMESQQYTDSHDVGFMINCSFGQAYRLTGKEEYRQVLVNAANTLAARFHPQIGCTRSWNRKTDGWQFVVIIDNMMNLELLTVGSGLTGDLTCYRMAKSHADRTLENHFRPDGSSYHVVNYDTLSFGVHNRFTHQGLADESSWSRGQAWGLYGYTMMYRQTGDSRYLAQAVKIGQFLMNHPNLPKDLVPYWDYDVKGGRKTPRDASAAALIASALIELSQYVEEAPLAQQFLRHAEKVMVSLSKPKYSAKKGTNSHFLLRHSTAFFAKGRDVDAPLPYADYYYVEALMRYRKLLQGRPVVDVLSASEASQATGAYDVYLCIGQSNMAGRGKLLQEDTLSTIPGVWILDDKGLAVPATHPLNRYSTIRKSIGIQQMSPAFSFSQKVAAATGRKVLLVVNARGGSNIKEWMKSNPKRNFYAEAVRRCREALEYGELKAILWHQGESNSADPSTYMDQLKELVGNLRNDLGAGPVPFVAGEIARWHRNAALFNPVINTISTEIPHGFCVSSQGAGPLIDKKDPHFNRDGQILIGERYAQIILEQVYQKKTE